MKPIVLFLIIIAVAACAVFWAWNDRPKPDMEREVRPVTGESSGGEPITAIPKGTESDPRKVALGKRLFHDTKLSKDESLSCASCHDLKKGGTDQQATSLGIDGANGTMNAPTVFNSGFNFKQFWDGRAHTLADQIDFPLQSPIEMGSTWAEVVKKLRANPDYVAAFNESYRDGIQPANIKDSIVHFEQSLSTPNSKFDKYLRGDENALTADEKAGYQYFKSYGCTSCHQGVNVGGNMFETLGTMADYFADRGHVTPADFGRFNVTGKEEDRYVFKVPSLRNVALTAPYFHDGSIKRLENAVSIMGKYQLGRKLSEEEKERIVKFLLTLTGEYEGNPL
jgi:cytochrome c peroxidase